MKKTISVSQIKQAVNEAYDLYKNNQDGKNADYIPYLANIDKNLFGISVCLLDGQIIEVGKTDIPRRFLRHMNNFNKCTQA